MTDIATALANNGNQLPPYAGMPVLRTTVSIRNAGDGLSEGMGIDPQLLVIGSKVYVVLECDVHAHDHVRSRETPGALVLDQVLKAGTAVIMDADVIKDAIAAEAERITRAKDKAAGRERLPYDEELAKAHDLGEHAAGLVPGCALCDGESTAEAKEAEQVAEPTPITGRRKKGL